MVPTWRIIPGVGYGVNWPNGDRFRPGCGTPFQIAIPWFFFGGGVTVTTLPETSSFAPENYAIPKGNEYSKHPFLGANMLLVWGKMLTSPGNQSSKYLFFDTPRSKWTSRLGQGSTFVAARWPQTPTSSRRHQRRAGQYCDRREGGRTLFAALGCWQTGSIQIFWLGVMADCDATWPTTWWPSPVGKAPATRT